MIVSGIAPLDQRLGGLPPGRTYVLTGATGTGKSVACLEFLSAGLQLGEPCVLLTQDDPADLLAQAEFLGLDIEPALADERLVLLRYQLDFGRRFARATSPDVAFAELRSLMGPTSPSRMVIDSVVPILEAGPASGAGIHGLLHFLEQQAVTALVTYPGDLAGAYDRRLQPLVQRAGAVLHFSSERDRTCRIEIRKVRFQVPSTQPIDFRIQPGVGMVAVADQQHRRLNDVPEETRRKVLVLNLAASFPDELLRVLRGEFDVAVRSGVASAYSTLALSSIGAVLIDVRHDMVNEALDLVRELRRGNHRSPILIVSSFNLRASDRARALRAGADEFLSAELHPDEFLLRLEAAIRNGHHAAAPVPDVELPLVVHADGAPLDATTLRGAVQAHLQHDRLPFFTLVRLQPQDGSPGELAALATRKMRVEGGDLAGVVDGTVVVYLHSARRKDVHPFTERLRDDWRRAGHGDLRIETVSYPGDEHAVHELLGSPEVRA